MQSLEDLPHNAAASGAWVVFLCKLKTTGTKSKQGSVSSSFDPSLLRRVLDWVIGGWQKKDGSFTSRKQSSLRGVKTLIVTWKISSSIADQLQGKVSDMWRNSCINQNAVLRRGLKWQYGNSSADSNAQRISRKVTLCKYNALYKSSRIIRPIVQTPEMPIDKCDSSHF